MNSGKICPLPEMIEIRKKHQMRIFIDESISFGVLGKTGRGILEHFNIHVCLLFHFFCHFGSKID